MKTALIVGATGLIGKQLLTHLLASDLFGEVKVLTRRSTGINHPKLKELTYDFDHPSGSLSADVVFCCLGTTIKKAGSEEAFKKVDYQYPLQVAKAALSGGAEQFHIVTALGADSRSLFFYNRVKGDVERELKQLGYAALHIYQPSLLLGDRAERRGGEKVGTLVMNAIDFLLIGPLKKYRGIDSAKVARAMVKFSSSSAKGVFTHLSDELQDF